MFGEGVSKDHEVAQLAVDYSIIEKSGSWFSYQGERLGQGITSVYDWLKNNPDMQVKIEEEVRARLSDKTPETDAE